MLSIVQIQADPTFYIRVCCFETLYFEPCSTPPQDGQIVEGEAGHVMMSGSAPAYYVDISN